MAFELYVWGPAFGLPSIDAQCLAAIAYLQQAIPRGKWHLIACSDPAAIPTNELPALRNGNIWIGGFRNIFHYVAQISGGEWVLDAGLPEQASADVVAFSSLVELHGQPLLDLSLYVSSQNYAAVTRPVYTTIQHFPLPYLTPHTIRAQAKRRTSHLGFSSLDIDAEVGEKNAEESIIPENLRRPKNTVSSFLLASPEKNAQIRLHGLATAFFEPLQALKKNKKFFVSNAQVSSLDCLALGYLSLMLVPDLPQPWLARTLRKDFPHLCSWVGDLRATVFGPIVTVADAFPSRWEEAAEAAKRLKKDPQSTLPWESLSPRDIDGTAYIFITNKIRSIPGFDQVRTNTRIQQHGRTSPEDAVTSSTLRMAAAVGCAIAGVGIAVYSFARRR